MHARNAAYVILHSFAFAIDDGFTVVSNGALIVKDNQVCHSNT